MLFLVIMIVLIISFFILLYYKIKEKKEKEALLISGVKDEYVQYLKPYVKSTKKAENVKVTYKDIKPVYSSRTTETKKKDEDVRKSYESNSGVDLGSLFSYNSASADNSPAVAHSVEFGGGSFGGGGSSGSWGDSSSDSGSSHSSCSSSSDSSSSSCSSSSGSSCGSSCGGGGCGGGD